MATLKLLPRKEFEITLDSVNDTAPVVIKGKYGTWALKRMCNKRGYVTLQAFRDAVSESISLDDILEIVLCAVEQKAREDNAAFSWTDVHAGMWIDEIGGTNSENFASLFNHFKDEREEKKTDDLMILQPTV